MKKSAAWLTANEICLRSKKESIKDLQNEYGASTVSMALRAFPRYKKFKLTDWKYRAVCATLSVPDSHFADFLDCMDVSPEMSVRQIQNRATAYKKHAMQIPEPKAIRTDLDYIVIDGKRFWITPAKVKEFKALLEDL